LFTYSRVVETTRELVELRLVAAFVRALDALVQLHLRALEVVVAESDLVWSHHVMLLDVPSDIREPPSAKIGDKLEAAHLAVTEPLRRVGETNLIGGVMTDGRKVDSDLREQALDE